LWINHSGNKRQNAWLGWWMPQVDRGKTIKKGKSSSKINEMRQKEAVPPKKEKNQVEARAVVNSRKDCKVRNVFLFLLRSKKNCC